MVARADSTEPVTEPGSLQRPPNNPVVAVTSMTSLDLVGIEGTLIVVGGYTT